MSMVVLVQWESDLLSCDISSKYGFQGQNETSSIYTDVFTIRTGAGTLSFNP
jgi:hypothetical protein